MNRTRLTPFFAAAKASARPHTVPEPEPEVAGAGACLKTAARSEASARPHLS